MGQSITIEEGSSFLHSILFCGLHHAVVGYIGKVLIQVSLEQASYAAAITLLHDKASIQTRSIQIIAITKLGILSTISIRDGIACNVSSSRTTVLMGYPAMTCSIRNASNQP